MALKGLSFNIDVDPKDRKAVTELISSNGGTVTYIAGASVNYLVASEDIIAKNGFKIQSAKKYGTQIVTVSFLHEKINDYVPPLVSEYSQENVATLVVYKPSNSSSSGPFISGIFPKEGKIGSIFKISVVGDNFKPTLDLRVKIGSLISQEIEYHCSSVILVTVRAYNIEPGEVTISASNNGNDFGNTHPFTLLEGDNTGVQAWHLKELQALRNRIFQLQSDLLDIQKTEYQLSVQFQDAIQQSHMPARLPVPVAQQPQLPQPSKPLAIQFKAEQKDVITAKDRLRRKTAAPALTSNKPVHDSLADDANREARIFISSPFKDMNEERDIVVKRIIPKLRKLCSERDIVLTCVDLRWGVTEAQTQGAATLLMCLREIEKSNIFIGLYGERYGWCLTENGYRKPTSQDELLLRTFTLAGKEFPWVNQYKDRSVTEIEMRMILDKNAKEQKAAIFYLRDPYYIESIPADKRQDFLSEGVYEKGKLDELKGAINKSPYHNSVYNRPTHLAELLFEDLSALINSKYPQGSELSPFKRERFLHNTYGRSLTRVYLPTEKLLMDLDLFASSNSLTPVVVWGEAGMGKSALLANWAKRYREHHPEVVVIEHYIGCTATSSNYLSILRRFMDELQEHLSDKTEDIPTNSSELERVFALWLEKTIGRNKVGKVVLLIDGLDNLDDSANAHTLLWLPRQFASSIRVVLSASPSRPLDMLRKRNYEMLEIRPIDEGERTSFIRQYLNVSSKKLSEGQEFRIAKTPQTGNPRYLKVLLEDINMWGQYEALDKRIDNDLKASDSSQLYEIVLERLEKDYDKDNKHIVKNFMSFLWASRRGLFLDAELGRLLEEEGLEFNNWQALYLGVEDLLLSSGGLINFANRDIRKAVEQRYLLNQDVKYKFHSRLATFFKKHIEGARERKVEELPHQLYSCEDWEQLKNTVTDLSMFYKLYTSHRKFDLLKYWRGLETIYDPVDSYIKTLERGDTLPGDVLQGDLYFQVGRFLVNIAKYEGASKVFLKARNVYNVGSQNIMVAKTDYYLARLMVSMAKYREAEDLFTKCMNLYIRESGEDDLAVAGTLTRLGGIYLDINQFEKAEQSFQKALHIRKSKLGTAHWKVAKTLTMMVNFYERTKKLDLAVECGNQALKIGEDEFGPDAINLTPTLVAIGRVYMLQQKFDEAKQIFKRALTIAEEKVGKDHPITAEIVYELGCFFFIKPEDLQARVNTAVVERFKQKDFWAKRDYSRVTLINKKEEKEEKSKGWSLDKAEKMFNRALTIIENTVGTDHPDYARILNRLGSLYIERVQFLKAEEYLLKALEIRILKFGHLHSRVAQTYKHLFTLYNLQEKLEQSRDCGQKALEVLRYIHGEQSVEVATIYERLGDQCSSAGLRDEAKQFFFKARDIRISLLGEDHKDTQAVINLINGLVAPPPPPPPPPMVIAVEDLYNQANVEITTEMKAQKGRGDLLEAIKNFGKMREQLHSAETVAKKQKKAANLEEKKGWWKQNYKAGFDASKITAGMLQNAKKSIMGDDDDMFTEAPRKPAAKPAIQQSKSRVPPPPSSRIPPPPPPMRK